MQNSAESYDDFLGDSYAKATLCLSAVFARERSDRSNPFLRKELENTKATELTQGFFKYKIRNNSSDSAESVDKMDLMNGLPRFCYRRISQ